MNSPPVAPTPTPGRPRKKATQKKNLLQMDLSSLRHKSATDDDDVEHPPFVPVLPHVNLLPVSIRQAIALRKVRRILIAVGLVLAVAAGGLWYVQGNQISEAEAKLALVQAENEQLAAKVEALAPIKAFYTQLTAQRGLVDKAMASQPLASQIVGRLDAAAGAAGIGKVTDINIDFGGIPPAGSTTLNACDTPDPFSTDITIGCMTFNATAKNREQVAELLRALDSDPVFIGPYVSSTTYGSDAASLEVTFSGSAGISLEGLARPLTEEQIAALINPPMPTPTPTPVTEGQ